MYLEKCMFAMYERLINKLNTPIFIAFFVSALALVYAAISPCVYQTMDDMEMRTLIDGSIGGEQGIRSPFSMYMSIVYGYILNFFYDLEPNFFWYDIFSFFFIFLSLFIISIAVLQDCNKINTSLKTVYISIIFFLGSAAFQTPQFTKIASLLAISSVILFYMIVNEYFDGLYKNLLLAIACIVCIIFSSFIRFNYCILLITFTSLLLFFNWPFKKIVRNKNYIILLISILLSVFLLHSFNVFLCKNNDEYRKFDRANNARAALTDRSNMYDNLDTPWIDAEKSVRLWKISRKRIYTS